jgi:hypothetical protein
MCLNERILKFNQWLNYSGAQIAPIFDEDDLNVRVMEVRRSRRRVLCTSQEFKEAIINTVEANISNSKWEGFLYIMCKKHRDNPALHYPLYVGKTEKKGKKKKLSSNIVPIRTNKSAFARWGYGNYWHIGQLSNSLFTNAVKGRHDNWAEELFETRNSQPKLKSHIYLAIINWYTCKSINPDGIYVPLYPALETKIIQISKQINPNLLNKQQKGRR